MARYGNFIAVLTFVLICNLRLLHAADNTTQKAVPLVDTKPTDAPATTSAPTIATTQKPKINIKNSVLCQKCKCEIEYLQIDCSNKSMNSVFSQDEWEILLNGDVLFETIKLNNNNISYVPELPTYPVKYLYLSFNAINNISLGAFKNLTQLSSLDLSHNKLNSKTLTPHVFKGQYAADKYEPLNNMKSLDLAYNELHTLKDDLFEHLPNLETLILCKNIFQVIDTSTVVAIASLTSLKTLDLSYMEISSLPETIFHSPTELETLILSGNLFKTLPTKALSLTKHLKKLVFDENPVSDFENENKFKSMSELEYLSISYLPDVTKIGAWTFSDLQNLTTLIASDNPKLTYIHQQAFTKNTTNPDIFVYPPLTKLYLHNNNLSYIEHDWIVRWDKITEINLNFNPWACDCTNSWFIHSLMQQINKTTPLLTENVKCATPLDWKNKPLMELSANKNELMCDNVHPEKSSLILVGILVGVLIGIPLTLGGLVIYRRGCFGLRNRGNPGADRSLYNRASFADEFHI